MAGVKLIKNRMDENKFICPFFTFIYINFTPVVKQFHPLK
jgi:hypothetical protein